MNLMIDGFGGAKSVEDKHEGRRREPTKSVRRTGCRMQNQLPRDLWNHPLVLWVYCGQLILGNLEILITYVGWGCWLFELAGLYMGYDVFWRFDERKTKNRANMEELKFGCSSLPSKRKTKSLVNRHMCHDKSRVFGQKESAVKPRI